MPSKVGLIQGDSYQVSDLFKALLMISANDAAVALAQATGSYAKGMALINAEAHHLQAYDTVAMRPNGLRRPGPARVRLRRGAVRPAGAGHPRVHARRARCGSSVSRSGRTAAAITPAG